MRRALLGFTLALSMVLAGCFGDGSGVIEAEQM